MEKEPENLKTLYLIRHAKSSWSNPRLADFDRGLNNRGKRDAPFMGKRLAECGVCPDLILASSAKRAKITAKIIAKEIGYRKKKIIFDEGIYSAFSVKDLLSILNSVADSNNSLFLVGHNHTITDFAGLLANRTITNIPTSGIVAITFPVKRWQKIAFGTGTLKFFDYPKKHTVKE